MVAVVLGHAWPFMPGEEYLQIWRMPLFFFLAGFFFSTTRDLAAEFHVRWRTLGIPYLTWLVLLCGLVIIHHYTPRPFEDTWWTVIGALYGGGLTDMPFLAFWFISVLFTAALLLRLVVRLPWWAQVLCAVGGLALAKVPESGMSFTPLAIGLAPACMAYMLAGYWTRRLIAHPRLTAAAQSVWAGVLGVALVVLGIGSVAAGVRTMNMKWSGFGDFLLSPAVAVTICIGLTLIFSTWAQWGLSRLPRAGVAVSELVRTGTLVVFFHPYVLFVIWDVIDVPLLRVAVALAVCWPLGLLVNRTVLSPYLTGLPREPKPPRSAPRTAAAPG